eukprot:2965863-Rhodomonas_salina.1
MQAQNGGVDMNELDTLQLKLARLKREWVKEKTEKKEEVAANDAEAEQNLRCAMSTVKRRLESSDDYDGGYDGR